MTSSQPVPLYSTYHGECQTYINQLLPSSPAKVRIEQYLTRRGRHALACQQDLLPWMVYQAVASARKETAVKHLTASWMLSLAAAHIMDTAQDTGELAGMNDSIIALGTANMALADMAVSGRTLSDILYAMGQVAVLSCQSQAEELTHGRLWSREQYFNYVAGKSAAIIATGAWLGGRLATDGESVLTALKSFGLMLGMAMQIGDDCQDLDEDLAQGLYTLPVIEGMAMVTHPRHAELQALVEMPTHSVMERRKISSLLNEMGAIAVCQRLIQVYQAQTASVFTILPNLALYFNAYVNAED